MTTSTEYKLSGAGVSVSYASETGSLEITLDSSYSPFDGTHVVSGEALTRQATDPGVQLSGVLHHESVGRGGPIYKSSSFTVFLPDTPQSTDEATEQDATGAVVFADPQPRAQIAPSYRAESLTGTLSVRAQDPPGRF